MTGSSGVYVVDDDEAVRDSLVALLRTRGYHVQAFANATAFLAALPSGATGHAFIDVRLPDISGLEVLQRMAAAGSAIRPVMITGYADVALAVAAMKAGAVDFLEKPFRPADILRCLQETTSPPHPRSDAESEVRRRLELLTPREREVLERLVDGKPNKVIGKELDISTRTVEVHRARVIEKMKAESLSHLVKMALLVGIARPL